MVGKVLLDFFRWKVTWTNLGGKVFFSLIYFLKIFLLVLFLVSFIDLTSIFFLIQILGIIFLAKKKKIEIKNCFNVGVDCFRCSFISWTS